MKEYRNVIPGFAPAAGNQYYCTSLVDLRENCWEPCEFRFRGFVPEIEKEDTLKKMAWRTILRFLFLIRSRNCV